MDHPHAPIDDPSSSLPSSVDFKLGDWWVRPLANELERAGTVERVEARSMAVLVCLARHAPGVVGKEQILREVWHDTPFSSDEVVTHAIWELRKALRDAARAPAYIQTLPRKGYRLVADVLRPQGAPLPVEGARINHYDLGEEIGRGSMGVVFQARDRRLGRDVAIKFLAPELTRDPKACQRFEREARLAASLDHPNLATVHEIGETTEGYRYLVQAYYPGGSLKGRLAEGSMPLDEINRHLRDVLGGLEAAHARGIVHRDVKPANLLLDDRGRVKIGDFGIAKLLGGTDLTRTGTPLGTPAYQSPEQALGQVVDHRADLWSVGIVLFEMLTSRRPTPGELERIPSASKGASWVLERADGTAVPDGMRDFLARTLCRNPEARFASATEMLAAVVEEAEDLGSIAWSDLAMKVRRWVSVALALVVVASAGIAISQCGKAAETPRPLTSEDSDWLLRAQEQWLRGNDAANLQQVEKHLERAVAQLPVSPRALGTFALFKTEQFALRGDPADRVAAEQMIRRISAIDEKNSLALSSRAWLAIQEENLQEGERLAREAIDSEKECPRPDVCDFAYLWLAESLLLRGRSEDAEAALLTGKSVGGGDVRCRLKLAQHFKGQGRYREAEGEYLDVLDIDATQSTALNDLGIMYLNMGRFDEARPLLRRAVKRTDDARTWSNLGYAFYGLGLWKDAIDAYRKSDYRFRENRELNPNPLLSIGDAYREQGMLDEAAEHYRSARLVFERIAVRKEDREISYAVCLAKLGELDRADEILQSLVESGSWHEHLLVSLARVEALRGDRSAVLELARRWNENGFRASLFVDDPSMIPYRQDSELWEILEP